MDAHRASRRMDVRARPMGVRKEIVMAKVNPIPPGYHTVTPALVVRGGKQALEFYKKAFGAKELGAMYMPDGQKLMHAEIQIGDSRIMLGEESQEMGAVSPQTLGGTPVALNIYVEDCD